MPKESDAVGDGSKSSSADTGDRTGKPEVHAGDGKEIADLKKELEDLQIKNLYSLVEIIPNEGRDSEKLLFLSNAQALKVDKAIPNVKKFVNAFKIEPEPKFIINLLLSTATMS